MQTGMREEVYNVHIALALEKRGIVTTAESIFRVGKSEKFLPDIIVEYEGLRVVIEGKVNEYSHSQKKVIEQSYKRLEKGVAHIAVALLYPPEIRKTSFSDLPERLSRIQFQINVITESGEFGWISGGIDYLADMIRHAFDELITEDTVAKAVSLLEEGIEKYASTVSYSKTLPSRCAKALGINEPKNTLERMAINRISALTILNAILFQEILSEKDKRIYNVRFMLSQMDIIKAYLEHWDFIQTKINYVPIFKITSNIFAYLPASDEVYGAIAYLSERAIDISRKKAALKHDLMGRIYHKLLSQRKYLGTYYTSVPAATFLLKLALNPKKWDKKWDSLKDISDFKIGDFACGTGTLLMSAFESIIDNYILKCISKGKKLQIEKLNRIIIENMLYGFDVLPSALHLTASTLAIKSSGAPFDNTHLYNLPLGGPYNRLGSIDFFINRKISIKEDLFGFDEEELNQVTGKGDKQRKYISLPKLDLCVMNPPFTRSVGGNLLFGSIEDKSRRKMQDKLKKILQNGEVLANTTAGLASVFIALGNISLDEGAKIGLVLPKAILSGISWEKSRRLLSRNFVIDVIAASHDPLKWNFSDNTDLSEALIIATKRKNNKSNYEFDCVNFWYNPSTSYEAISAAQSLLDNSLPNLYSDNLAESIRIGRKKVGECCKISFNEMHENWILPFLFAQSELNKTAYFLEKDRLHIPGKKDKYHLEFFCLEDIGHLGFDRRDVYDAFEKVDEETGFPTFWSHKTEECVAIQQKPNGYLNPLSKARTNRKLRKYSAIWEKSSNLLLAERFAASTNRLITIRLDQNVISNVWWNLILKEEYLHLDKAIALWMNSTIGVISVLRSREDTHGGWISVKKPSYSKLKIPRFDRLDKKDVDAIDALFEKVKKDSFLKLSEIEKDVVRSEIDNLFEDIFNYRDADILRKYLGREPIITNTRL